MPLCVASCPSQSTNGEIGGESHPEGKGHSACKREKGNSNFLHASLTNRLLSLFSLADSLHSHVHKTSNAHILPAVLSCCKA